MVVCMCPFVGRSLACRRLNRYSRAIDAYLKITKEHTADYDMLERTWNSAAHLAVEYVPKRVNEVVTIITKRLIDLQRYDRAAEMHMSVDHYKEAVDSYIRRVLFCFVLRRLGVRSSLFFLCSVFSNHLFWCASVLSFVALVHSPCDLHTSCAYVSSISPHRSSVCSR